jgi:hypothetical protein
LALLLLLEGNMPTTLAISPRELATVTGGTESFDRATKKMLWWGNVVQKGIATGADLSGKGFVAGGVIGAGAAAAGGVTLPAVGLAAWGGAKTGAAVGFGLGFVAGAGVEAYRTWNQ